MEDILLSWSGGKDSALALYEIRRTKNCKVAALITTVTRSYDRISMHGVRRILLEKQAASLELPLEIVWISDKASNEEYENQMAKLLAKYKKSCINTVAFGDIFLEDLRQYREDKLSSQGMHSVFPLWKRDTKELAHSLVPLGFKAIITCVDTKALDGSFVGRTIDESFLSDLPPSVDSCGENGEFHSFIYEGPILKDRIAFAIGEKVLREDRFYFCDLVPE